MRLPQLIFLVGPTATGKTAIAVEAVVRARARAVRPIEIISADSVQFYQELKIGSARPTDDELSKVKHHFVGHISVAQDFTAGDFEREAKALIDACPKTDFLVVGGSGFYIQALEKGMYPIHRKSEEIQNRIEARIDETSLTSVYHELATRDPETAKKIAPQDRYRIVRALEILETLGAKETLSQLRLDFESTVKDRFPGREVRTFGLKLERTRLEPKVLLRVRQMLAEGLVDEVKTLVKMGFGERPALQSVGYKEVLQALSGELSFESLPAMIGQGTLRLAKKQRTWFARGVDTRWFDAELEREEAVAEIVRALD